VWGWNRGGEGRGRGRRRRRPRAAASSEAALAVLNNKYNSTCTPPTPATLPPTAGAWGAPDTRHQTPAQRWCGRCEGARARGRGREAPPRARASELGFKSPRTTAGVTRTTRAWLRVPTGPAQAQAHTCACPCGRNWPRRHLHLPHRHPPRRRRRRRHRTPLEAVTSCAGGGNNTSFCYGTRPGYTESTRRCMQYATSNSTEIGTPLAELLATSCSVVAQKNAKAMPMRGHRLRCGRCRRAAA
jgi:hypothetical protein